MDIKQISLQIYTARNFKPYDNIIKFLSEQGMKKVELFEVEAFPETKELLNKYEMSSPSSHIGFSTLENTKLLISNLKESNITKQKNSLYMIMLFLKYMTCQYYIFQSFFILIHL